MKSNKGVTLTTLVIYLICLVFSVGLISSLTDYFYKNSNEIIVQNNSHEQYTKFLTYIIKDLNRSDLQSCQIDANQKNTLVFNFENEKKHKYVLKEGKLYYENPDPSDSKKVVLCKEVSTDESNIFKCEDNKLTINIFISGDKFSNYFAIKTGN